MTARKMMFIDRDLAGERLVDLGRNLADYTEKDECGSQRVDQGQQSSKRDQESIPDKQERLP